MSRAHIQGYDSNAEQFARMGNPWVSERERQEFSAPNKKERRQNRNPKRAKPLGKFPRTADYTREGSPEFEAMRAKRHRLGLFKAALGNCRSTMPAENAAALPVDPVIRHPSLTELTGWQRFERQVVRVRQRAEVAKRCEAVAIADERARLEGIIKAAQARLASLA